jgi:hypothetical protein
VLGWGCALDVGLLGFSVLPAYIEQAHYNCLNHRESYTWQFWQSACAIAGWWLGQQALTDPLRFAGHSRTCNNVRTYFVCCSDGVVALWTCNATFSAPFHGPAVVAVTGTGVEVWFASTELLHQRQHVTLECQRLTTGRVHASNLHARHRTRDSSSVDHCQHKQAWR